MFYKCIYLSKLLETFTIKYYCISKFEKSEPASTILHHLFLTVKLNRKKSFGHHYFDTSSKIYQPNNILLLITQILLFETIAFLKKRPVVSIFIFWNLCVQLSRHHNHSFLNVQTYIFFLANRLVHIMATTK